MEDYQQQGFATKMFEETIAWARNQGLRRLELTVLTHNNPAISLYHDELYMAKMLNKEEPIAEMNIW